MATVRPSARRTALQVCAVAAVTALALASCSTGGGQDVEQAVPEEPTEEPSSDEPDVSEEVDPASDEPTDDDQDAADDEPAEPPVDPAEVGADELGVVPIMMYHQVREDGGSEWDMSPEEFRAELVRLFDLGFVPIRTVDLVRGDIDVPAGRSPVVLTFDDSPRNQARLDEDGNMAENTAMGILIDVAADYEDVEPVASLYLITQSMFGAVADSPDIVRALHDLGMELGNHTHTHANLRSLDGDQVQEELARNVAEITDIVPGSEGGTLSLPFGISPEDRDLVAAGQGPSGGYVNEGVLLVGDRPAPSPFHADFNPLAIPRIKTLPDPEDEFGSAWWIDVMMSSDTWRPYVSDGNPATISFPREREDELDPAYADRANPY